MKRKATVNSGDEQVEMSKQLSADMAMVEGIDGVICSVPYRWLHIEQPDTPINADNADEWLGCVVWYTASSDETASYPVKILGCDTHAGSEALHVSGGMADSDDDWWVGYADVRPLTPDEIGPREE